jgi:hypothetical protein
LGGLEEFFIKARAKELLLRRRANYIIKLEKKTLPPFLPLCLLLLRKLKVLREWLKKSLKLRRITYSKSPASVLVLFVLKKNRTL